MADVKISGLPASTVPLAGTEVLPVVQSGVTKKVASDDLTVKNVRSNATTGILQVAGPATGTTRLMTAPDANFAVARTDAAQSFTGDQTLSTGNLVMGTADKGIDFSINSAAAGVTSELLNDYETGTWTPTYTANTGAFGTIVYNTNTFGRYTKVGNAVVLVGLIVTDEFDVGTGSGSQGRISGLPYTPSPSSSASINYSVNFATINPTGSFTSGANIFLTQRATANGPSAAFNSANFTTGVSSFGNYIAFQMNYTV
jgi:hypothetical protein